MTVASETIAEKALAKINLDLHVGARRPDGLHELISYVVFADLGDDVTAAPSNDLALDIKGPFAGDLAPFPLEDNLVLKAARALQTKAPTRAGAHLTLHKHLPVAAGIGGGSADAAAALRALVRLWSVDLAPGDLAALAFSLGADVPACLASAPVIMSGAGETVRPGPPPPSGTALVLVNPGRPVPTGPVFSLLAESRKGHSSLYLDDSFASGFNAFDDFAAFLKDRANDLETPAIKIQPLIKTVLEMLRASVHCSLARMSGSGATCFALCRTYEDACALEASVRAQAPDWWVRAARLTDGGGVRV